MVYYFDKDGTFDHRTGSDGKFFDTFGNNQGYRDKEGRYFDAGGAFKGTVKEDGMFYDTSGKCLGYTDGKAWPFDPLGCFIESKRKQPKAEDEESEKKEKKGFFSSLKSDKKDR